MNVSSLLATRNYQLASGAGTSIASGPDRPTMTESFAQVTQDVIQTLRSSEETAIKGMAGEADAHSVVKALAQSELAIETAVTLRDKVVEAYQEILRMPV